MNSNESAHDVNDGQLLSYGVSTPNFCSHDVFFQKCSRGVVEDRVQATLT